MLGSRGVHGADVGRPHVVVPRGGAEALACGDAGVCRLDGERPGHDARAPRPARSPPPEENKTPRRRFPGNLATDTPFSSLPTNPLDAWAQVPYDGKVQMLVAIGLAEFHSEFSDFGKKHYTAGGPFPGNQLEFKGDNRWTDVWGGKVIDTTSAKTDKQFLNQQNAELNNGRLAMIGIMGFSAAATVPGSIPLLADMPGILAAAIPSA